MFALGNRRGFVISDGLRGLELGPAPVSDATCGSPSRPRRLRRPPRRPRRRRRRAASPFSPAGSSASATPLPPSCTSSASSSSCFARGRKEIGNGLRGGDIVRRQGAARRRVHRPGGSAVAAPAAAFGLDLGLRGIDRRRGALGFNRLFLVLLLRCCRSPPLPVPRLRSSPGGRPAVAAPGLAPAPGCAPARPSRSQMTIVHQRWHRQ